MFFEALLHKPAIAPGQPVLLELESLCVKSLAKFGLFKTVLLRGNRRFPRDLVVLEVGISVSGPHRNSGVPSSSCHCISKVEVYTWLDVQ